MSRLKKKKRKVYVATGCLDEFPSGMQLTKSRAISEIFSLLIHANTRKQKAQVLLALMLRPAADTVTETDWRAISETDVRAHFSVV